MKKVTVEPELIASWWDCAMQELSLRYIPSPALVFSTLLLPQTSWFANNVVSSGIRTAAHGRSHRRLLSMQRNPRAPFSNLITRLLVPAALNLHGSLPTFFITFFFYKAKRTDKLSGTQDLIVNGWPAAKNSSPHNCFGPHCIKQMGFTRQHRTIRILPRVQGSSMLLSLPTSTVVSNHLLEILRPIKCPACPSPHKKKQASPNKPMSICPWIHYSGKWRAQGLCPANAKH